MWEAGGLVGIVGTPPESAQWERKELRPRADENAYRSDGMRIESARQVVRAHLNG